MSERAGTYKARMTIKQEELVKILASFFDTEEKNVRIYVNGGYVICEVDIEEQLQKRPDPYVPIVDPVSPANPYFSPYNPVIFAATDTAVETKEPASDTKDYPPYLDYPRK